MLSIISVCPRLRSPGLKGLRVSNGSNFLTLFLNLVNSFSCAIRHEALHRRVRLHHRQNLPSGQPPGILVGNSGSSRISARLRRAEITMGRRDSSRLFGNGPGQLRRDFSSEVHPLSRVFRRAMRKITALYLMC